MWICLNNAYLSAVALKSHEPGAGGDLLKVRARLRGHLESAFPGCEVIEGGGTDYRFRTIVTRSELKRAMAHAIEAIDYTNFKDSCPDDLHDAYMALWRSSLGLQHREENAERAKGRKVGAGRKRKAKAQEPDFWWRDSEDPADFA